MCIDLIDAVERVARRKWRPRRVVVGVTAGEVIAAVYTILSDPDLRRLVHLDGVVVAVDAVAMATRSRAAMPVVDDADASALAIADRVVLAKADRVLGQVLENVHLHVAGRARFATVLAPSIAPVIGADLLELDAWHGVPNVAPDDAPGRGAVHHQGSIAGPRTVVLHQDGLLDSDGVEGWINGVIASHAPRLLRLQGVLAVSGSTGQICCHGVRSYAMSHPDADHPSRGPPASLVAIAGIGLDAGALAAGLGRTRVR